MIKKAMIFLINIYKKIFCGFAKFLVLPPENRYLKILNNIQQIKKISMLSCIYFVTPTIKETKIKSNNEIEVNQKNENNNRVNAQKKDYYSFTQDTLDYMTISGLYSFKKTCYYEDTFYDTEKFELAQRGYWLKERKLKGVIKRDLKWVIPVAYSKENTLLVMQYKDDIIIDSILNNFEIRKEQLVNFSKIFVKRVEVETKQASRMYLESYTFDKKNYYLIGTSVYDNEYKPDMELKKSLIQPVRSKVIQFIFEKHKWIYDELKDKKQILNLDYFESSMKYDLLEDTNKTISKNDTNIFDYSDEDIKSESDDE